MVYIGLADLSAFMSHVQGGVPVYVKSGYRIISEFSREQVVIATQEQEKKVIYLAIPCGTLAYYNGKSYEHSTIEKRAAESAESALKKVKERLSDFPVHNGVISFPKDIALEYGTL